MRFAAVGVFAALVITVSAGMMFLLNSDAERATQEATRDRAFDPQRRDEGDGQAVELLSPRVQELEAKLAVFENRIRELESTRADASSPAEGENAMKMLAAALEAPSPELEELLVAAMDEVRQRQALRKSDAKREQGAKGLISFIDGELDRWSDEYDLTTQEIDELKSLTRRAIDQRMAAEADGASRYELTQLGVETQGEVRRIVGDEVYRRTERDRLTREARGKLMWLTVAVGGLSEEQHASLDSVVDGAVEDRLDDVIRMRAEPMPEDEYNAVGALIKQDQASTWANIREDVLTEEQRRRIPGK